MARGSAAGLAEVDAAGLAALAPAGGAGYLIAGRLWLPAPAFLGPLLASAGIHLASLTAAQPPWELVAAAQVVIGAAIGGRFAGTDIRLVPRILTLAVGSTAIFLAMAAVAALVLERLTDFAFPALLLAFTPGGLAEMSLVALALDIDTAFVATHNVARIALIVTLAPLFFRLLGRHLRRPADE